VIAETTLMDAQTLVGSWMAESGDSHLEFKADGTYIRVTSIDFPMSYTNLSIDDEGPFSTADGTITFTPTSGHYRRNGVDEGFDRTVRVVRARFEVTEHGHDLILDDLRFSPG
jgi:hypothetical protein